MSGAKNPFWLPNGAAARGRPDLIALLTSRGGALSQLGEAAGLGDRIRDGARSASPGKVKVVNDGPNALRALLGDDVPSGMLGSEFSKLGKMSAGNPHKEDDGPSRGRPTSRGAIRLKDTLVSLRASELHSVVQRPRDAAAAAALPPFAGLAPPGSPPRAQVRVGTPAVLAFAVDGGDGFDPPAGHGAASRSLGYSGGASRTGLGGGASSPARAVWPNQLCADTSMVSLANATADLPVAAVKAVRGMLQAGAKVTVAGIHQRRPPYIDRGPDPLLGHTGGVREAESAFTGSLRFGGGNWEAARNHPPFRVGCPPPWARSSPAVAPFDTFDYGARTSAAKYYVGDFTAPTRASLRPGTASATRPALNNAPQGPRQAPLLNVDRAYEGEDHGYRMRHADQGVLLKRPTTSGSHLLPYANDVGRTRYVAYP
jgi:hypothetical protein